MKTFEEYLRDNVWEPEGILDDYMPDAFDNWCAELDVQEVMDYADDTNIGYTKQERQQLKSLIIKDLVETGDIPRISIEDLQ